MEDEYVWGENGMYRISSSVAVQWLVCLSLSLEITEASFLKWPVRCLALNVSSIADLHENSPSLSLSLALTHILLAGSHLNSRTRWGQLQLYRGIKKNLLECFLLI